jgi:hypothetical protein
MSYKRTRLPQDIPMAKMSAIIYKYLRSTRHVECSSSKVNLVKSSAGDFMTDHSAHLNYDMLKTPEAPCQSPHHPQVHLECEYAVGQSRHVFGHSIVAATLPNSLIRSNKL